MFQNCYPKYAKKCANMASLVPNLRIYIFAGNFAIRQVRGPWFLNVTIAFLNSSEKTT